MSLEQLRADMKSNTAELARLGESSTTGDLVAFIKNTLWPTIEAAVNELEEVDGCVEDLLNAQEDILQPETAQLFAALVVAGRGIAAELAKRLRADEGDVRKLCEGFEQLAKSAEEAIEEITVPEGDNEDDGDDEVTK